MKNRIISAILVGALAITLLAGGALAGTDHIKIGGLFALTGWFDSYDVAGSKGFELAVEEINAAGGIDGHEVEYVIYDTTSDLQTATNLTNKLIEQDKVDVLVGLNDPNTDIACGIIAQEYGIPSLATVSTLPYTQERVGDTAFLVPYGDNVQSAAVSEYAYNVLGIRSVYVGHSIQIPVRRSIPEMVAARVGPRDHIARVRAGRTDGSQNSQYRRHKASCNILLHFYLAFNCVTTGQMSTTAPPLYATSPPSASIISLLGARKTTY